MAVDARPARAGPTRRSPSRSRDAVQFAARARRARHRRRPRAHARPFPHLARSRRARSSSSSPTAATATRELLGAAAAAHRQRARGHAREHRMPTQLVGWGADEIVHLDGENVEEDVARAVARSRASANAPWAILGRSHRVGPRGRVARRGAPRRRSHRRRGRARTSTTTGSSRGSRRSAVSSSPRSAARQRCRWRPSAPACSRRSRRVPSTRDRARDDRARRHAVASACSRAPATTTSTCSPRRTPSSASARGVGPTSTPRSNRCASLLGAELGATRKVTDKGWLPRARQIGITGRTIAPRLFVSIGASGKFNHTVGVRAAGTVLAINPDPDAPIFDARRRRHRRRLARRRSRCSSSSSARGTPRPRRRPSRARAGART